MPTYIVQVRAIRHLTAEITVEASDMQYARQLVQHGLDDPVLIHNWDESDPEDKQIESIHLKA